MVQMLEIMAAFISSMPFSPSTQVVQVLVNNAKKSSSEAWSPSEK